MQMLFSFFYFMLYFAGIMQAEVFFCFNEKIFFKDLWHSYNSLHFFSSTRGNAILIPHKATMLYS